jgi:conflict system STAND superfamily ATPase
MGDHTGTPQQCTPGLPVGEGVLGVGAKQELRIAQAVADGQALRCIIHRGRRVGQAGAVAYHCARHPDLVQALEDSQVLLGAMTVEEFRRAVTRPAAATGCAVEAALLTQLAADAAGRIGTLRLVSHALLVTWRRRRGNTLTLAGYQATGGIRSALAQTAETVYGSLSAPRQRLAKQALLRLTALGDGTQDTKTPRRPHRTGRLGRGPRPRAERSRRRPADHPRR